MAQPPAEITGYMTALALDALRQVSGEQYARILKASQLARFIDQPPPRTAELVSSAAEWSQLQHNVYKMLGENFYRLFGRNLGTQMGQGIILTPWAGETAAQLQQIAPSARIDALLTRYVAWAAGQGVVYQRISRPTGHYLMLPQPCTLCAGITGVSKPICSVYPAAVTIVASHLYGSRLYAEECECQAMGDPACVITITSK